MSRKSTKSGQPATLKATTLKPRTLKARTLKVGAAQLTAHKLDEADSALAEIEAVIKEAAEHKVELLVLPECAYPAYALGSRDAYKSAKKLKTKAFVKKLYGWTKEHSLHIVCGFVDDENKQLRNAAVVIDADGNECGRYSKTFLWGADNDYFESGEALAPIDTPLGKIGVLICADGRAPEIATGLANQGAELIAVPTCWVNVAKETNQYRNAQAEFMIRARAIESGLPIVAANKCGIEGDTPYCGMSQIVDINGELVASAPPDEAKLIVAEIPLGHPKQTEIPTWGRRRIFSDYEPIVPERAELGEIKIAVAPTECVFPKPDTDESPPLERLAAAGTNVVGTSLPDPETSDRLDIYCRALGMSLVGFPYVERLMIESFGATACIESQHAASFPAMRIMALDGASIVFVVGEEVSRELLQTRAAENCIYVAHATAKTASLIDPSGKVIDQTHPNETRIITATIDLRLSANKEVYSKTHIWQQRKPELYAKAFDITERFTTTS